MLNCHRIQSHVEYKISSGECSQSPSSAMLYMLIVLHTITHNQSLRLHGYISYT